MTSNNIVMFPKGKMSCPPQSMEEILDNVETSRKDHIEMFMDEVMEYLVYRACDSGFPITEDNCNNNVAIAYDAIRAMLYKSMNLYHPLHDIADNLEDFVKGSE